MSITFEEFYSDCLNEKIKVQSEIDNGTIKGDDSTFDLKQILMIGAVVLVVVVVLLVVLK